MLIVVGAVCGVVGVVYSYFAIARYRRIMGDTMTGYELQQRRGTVVPPIVSFLYLLGVGLLVGGALWWIVG